ncbi:hypothetical protein MASR2M8_03720 [Opitutaceae bacterium]
MPGLFAGLALLLAVYSPVTSVMDTQLDSSNFASYTYFAANGFQYGPEVVPMSGPFGYVMYGAVYNGLLFWHRLAAQLICSAAFAALVLWFFRRNQGTPLRWVWLGLMLLLSPVIDDLPFEWMMLLGGLFLVQSRPHQATLGQTLLVTGLLAFLSLVKGTHLVLSIATLGVVVGCLLIQRNGRRAAWIVGGYVSAFLIFWLMAGQDPRNIPSFLRGIQALTSGYNEAMSLDETPDALFRGLVALGSLGLAILWGGWHRRHDLTAVASTCLFLGYTFVKWKHGYVRADGHIYIFHHYVAVASVFWFLVAYSLYRQTDHRFVRPIAVVLMFCGIGGGLWIESVRTSVLRLHWLVVSWTPEHVRAVGRELLSPVQTKKAFDLRLAEQRDIYVMPLTQQAAADASIDLFGVQHGTIPLNGLNYRPRPMGGGAFNSYNAYLMGLNREFIRDPARRPDYYLMRFETIDNRLAALDDSLTLLELLNHYQPLLIEREHVLFKAVRDPRPVDPILLERRTFKFGEFVAVPAVAPDQLVLARFDIRPTLKGKIRSAVYKAPLNFMTIQGEGIDQPESRRFIPGMAAVPFIFSPALETNVDVAHLYTRLSEKLVTGFFIYSNDPTCYEPVLEVEFYTTPRPTPPQAPDIEELLAFTRFPVFNVQPVSVTAHNAQQMHLRSLLIQTLNAPGEIVWELDGTEQELVFDYGFMPEAYQRGASNGAVFRVELRTPGVPPQELFRTLVDPANRPADRGNLTARIAMPAIPPGSRLALLTDPGEHGDNAWDWCYVTRVQIKRGNFASERFPNFNREPITVEPESAGLTDLAGDQVFFAHVPGAITFPLQGDEQRVRLGFGFLPGAYTGEGRTDGASFTVELHRPGQAPIEVFRQDLHPYSSRADRGTHEAEVHLPDIAAGDRLLVRTRPPDGGSNSWGWTYFSRIVIN